MSRGTVQVGTGRSDDRVATAGSSERGARRVRPRETTQSELATERPASPSVVPAQRRRVLMQPRRRVRPNQVSQTRTELPAVDRSLEQRAEAGLDHRGRRG